MRIVVVGGGQVGLSLCEQLSKEDHQITVVDTNTADIRRIADVLDINIVSGNGAAYATLQEADAQNADLVIAATSSDEANMICCMLAKKMGAQRTIARVRNPEYREQLILMRDELGLSMVINPEQTAAQAVAHGLYYTSASSVATFAKGRIDLLEIRVEENARLADKQIKDLRCTREANVLIAAVERNGEVFIPNGDFRLCAGDRIHVAGASSNLMLFLRIIGRSTRKTEMVMLVGGSKIAGYLCPLLENSGIKVKLVEHDAAVCEKLSAHLNKTLVINGVETDQELLLSEDIESMDAVIALTDNDEDNLMVSLFAVSHKVPKVITKLDRLSYAEVLSSVGLDNVFSPKISIANAIVRYVRSLSNSLGSEIESLHRIVGGKAEIVEFAMTNRGRHLGIPLSELNMKPNVLISGIVRGGKAIIPRGSDKFEANDHVLVVTTHKRLDDFDKIFAE